MHAKLPETIKSEIQLEYDEEVNFLIAPSESYFVNSTLETS